MPLCHNSFDEKLRFVLLWQNLTITPPAYSKVALTVAVHAEIRASNLAADNLNSTLNTPCHPKTPPTGLLSWCLWNLCPELYPSLNPPATLPTTRDRAKGGEGHGETIKPQCRLVAQSHLPRWYSTRIDCQDLELEISLKGRAF